VALVQNPPTTADPSQQGGNSRSGSFGKYPKRTHSSQARRKSTGSVRTGRGQSPIPMTSDRSRTPDRARTPIRRQTPDREVTSDRGKSHATTGQTIGQTIGQTTSARDPRTAPGGQHSEHPVGSDPAPIPSIRRSAISRTPGSRTPRAEETGDSEDKIAPSPNMRRALTQL
jgi:hypothetical protein